MPDVELDKELEQLAKDLQKDDDDFDSPDDPSAEPDPDEEKEEEPKGDEGSQKADSDDDDPVQEDTDEDPKSDPDETAPKLTTLPDDPETFGELAGKEVTAEQLIEEGFLGKLVTWGHQGRHMVQKGQEKIEEAKKTESELTKLREILEKQVALDEKAAQPKPKEVSEEDYANSLVKTYIPGLKEVADQGGVEVDFIKEFPKAASHFEHRLQSGANVLKSIVDKVEEIAKFVGHAEEDKAVSDARETYHSMTDDLASKGGELFSPLAKQEVKDNLLDWLSEEETGLRIADKGVTDLTPAELQSAWLLYVHSNPDVLKKVEEVVVKKETDSHLAGGGGGGGGGNKRGSKSKGDELSNFEQEFKDAESESWNR